MGTVVYIVDPDAEERKWLESALAPGFESVRSLDDAGALPEAMGISEGACLVLAVEPDEAMAVETVRRLRESGNMIPVVAVGPGTSFQTATRIARFDFTDFLDRPLRPGRLRTALRRACASSK